MALMHLGRKSKGQGQTIPPVPFPISVHLHGSKQGMNMAFLVRDSISWANTGDLRALWWLWWGLLARAMNGPSGHVDEFVFKTYHPSVRADRGPGLQSATAFEVLTSPISLSDIHELHQGPTALPGPEHPVLALCLPPDWILQLGCSSVSSSVSASISWWSGLDPGPCSSPHLVQGSAPWHNPLWHNEPSLGFGLCLTPLQLPGVLPQETPLLSHLPAVSFLSDKWSSNANHQEVPPGDLHGRGWWGWWAVL